jgi:NAD+ synthase
VFDGASFALDRTGEIVVQMPAWEEAVITTEWRRGSNGWDCKPGLIANVEEGDAANYLACVTGLRDYVNKNGFPGVVLGLSGGVDSALCAILAVDALGADRVHCVMLPPDQCGGRRAIEELRRDDRQGWRGRNGREFAGPCARRAVDGDLQ